jgi:pimeloyl-ACP methyl ester carboxylesterase
VHLFGNSMGGAIAVQIAGRHPHLIRTLTLVSPALPKVGVRRTNVHLPVIAAPGLGTTLMKRYLTLDPDTRAKATIDVCFADPSSVPTERMNEAVQEVRRRDALPYTGDVFVQSLRGLLATYLDRSDERPWKLAERITVPTLLVYGRADKLVDPIHAHTKAFPDVRVLVLPHAGHVSQIEQPVLVADAWHDLLRAGATR